MVTALVPFADVPYFRWQALVHWTWMRSHGWPVRYLAYCGKAPSTPSAEIRAMIDAGMPLTVWNDWRPRPLMRYGPGMKPGLVARWLEAHPEQVAVPQLVLDPDALPLPSFYAADLTPTSTQWLGTDTHSYTGSDYLKSKGVDLWQSLCELAEVDHTVELQGAGAQLLTVGQPHTFWDDVHRTSCTAHQLLTKHRSDVQVWCAEMYLTQLRARAQGIEIAAHPAMAMVWANGPIERWDDGSAGFFHDAGVPKPNGRDFCKIEHQTAPFGKPLTVRPESASARYVEVIRETESMFPTLLA